jgi:hypothetical protein
MRTKETEVLETNVASGLIDRRPGDLKPWPGSRRLDGWANRDLNVGAIVALASNLQPFSDLLGVDQATVRKVLQSWGPRTLRRQLKHGSQSLSTRRKSGSSAHPSRVLAGVNLHTWTGWGGVSHWNAFVANLEMHGKGTFFDPRLDDATQFPVAAKAGFGHVKNDPDLITAKLPALHLYQLAIPAPRPPAGSFNKDAAARGKKLFAEKAQCSNCHVPPLYTEPGWNMHTPSEVCVDSFQADRAPDRRYRASPLNGLWTHTKGGFYHDGRFGTLRAVINHYDSCLNLSLADQEKADLVEFLKSLPQPKN